MSALPDQCECCGKPWPRCRFNDDWMDAPDPEEVEGLAERARRRAEWAHFHPGVPCPPEELEP
jgi:hypothetical protein